jgi:putative CocE/NonD family hydrolase
MSAARSEIRDGMQIEWDAAVPMDDGIVLGADVFRPAGTGKCPAILNYGPYAKGHAFQDSRKFAWERMIKQKPEVARGTSNTYQNWEVVDPEKWVADGYAIVRVDARGTGRSPGYVDPWSPRETQDLYQCIEWAASQEWCTSKVGLNGISYFAMNAWQVAALSPPHLAAVCAWEGAADHYRETCHHGGIYSEFISNWYPRAISGAAWGRGARAAQPRHRRACCRARDPGAGRLGKESARHHRQRTRTPSR